MQHAATAHEQLDSTISDHPTVLSQMEDEEPNLNEITLAQIEVGEQTILLDGTRTTCVVATQIMERPAASLLYTQLRQVYKVLGILGYKNRSKTTVLHLIAAKSE